MKQDIPFRIWDWGSWVKQLIVVIPTDMTTYKDWFKESGIEYSE